MARPKKVVAAPKPVKISKKASVKAIVKAPSPKKQIEQLAKFIMSSVPGEPSRNEGAVECAIRLISIAIAADVYSPVKPYMPTITEPEDEEDEEEEDEEDEDEDDNDEEDSEEDEEEDED